jgi:isopenicillin N synthase-like dioxygenase
MPGRYRVDQKLGLPIVDLGGLAAAAEGGDPDRLLELGAAFDEACGAYGFCYIVNHGVDQDLIDRAFAMNAAFHALPLEEKQRIAINKAHRGYMALASSLIVTSSIEKAVRPNLSESFMLMHEVAPGEGVRPLDGPNQWPREPTGFREVVGTYDAILQRLARQMTRMIAVALGLEPNGLDRYFERPTTFLRLLHYPPSPPDADDRQYGSAPHTDYGFITILAQDQQGGLQVRGANQVWIDATPLPGAFLVNIGDMGSRWSNGLWPSTPHRVINRSGGDRYAMPYFFDPTADAVVACLPSCCSDSRPARFEPVRYGDYLMTRIDANYAYRKNF